MSGLHYGTYKASAKDTVASEALAKQMTLVARSGVYPPRWEVALQSLLAKAKGATTIDKSRYLILFEGDYNQFKGHFIGGDANNALEELGVLPDEHFSRRGSTAIDCKFDSTLVEDIGRMSHIPMAITSCDASQCYDRVLLLIQCLVWMASLKDC